MPADGGYRQEPGDNPAPTSAESGFALFLLECGPVRTSGQQLTAWLQQSCEASACSVVIERPVALRFTSPITTPEPAEAVARADFEHGRVRGYIEAQFRDRPLPPDCDRTLRFAGALLARALDREFTTEARGSDAHQDLLAEIAATTASSATPEDLLRRLRAPLGRLVPAPFIAFGYLDDGHVTYPNPAGPPVRSVVDPAIEIAVRDGQIVRDEFQDTDSTPGGGMLLRAGVQRVVLSTGYSAGVPIGVLITGTRTPGHVFTAEDLALLRIVAGIVGPAMANARISQQAAWDARDQRILAAVASAAARAATPEQLLLAIREPMKTFVPQPWIDFGYIEGDAIEYPIPGRGPHRSTLDRSMRDAVTNGQVHGVAYPESDGPLLPGVQILKDLGVVARTMTTSYIKEVAFGLLVVGSRDPEFRFSERDLVLLRSLADVIGPAMANARAAELAVRDAREQRVIAETAAAMAGAVTQDELLRALRAPLRLLVPRAWVDFGYLREATVEYHLPGRAPLITPLDDGVLRAIEHGQSMSVGYFGEAAFGGEPSPGALVLQKAGVHARITTASYVKGDILGVLVVGSRDETFVFSDRDRQLLRVLAGIIGPAMANAEAAEIARRDVEEQRTLAEVAAAAAAAASPEDLLVAIRNPIGRIISRPWVTFGYVEGSNLSYPVPGRPPTVTPAGLTASIAFASGQAVTRREEANPSEAAGILDAAGVHTRVATACYQAGEPYGLFVTASRDPAFEFSDRSLQLLRVVASIVGPAMQNARAAEAARQDAEEQRLIREIATAAAREQRSFDITRSLAQEFASIVPSPRIYFAVRSGAGAEFEIGNRRFYADTGPVGDSVFGGEQAVFHGDTSSVVEPFRSMLQETGVTALTLAPAFSATVGPMMMMVGTREPDYRFDDRALRIIALSAQIACPAVASSWARERAEREAVEQRLIAAVSSAAASTVETADFFAFIAEPLARIVPWPFAMVGLVEEGESTWRAASGPVRLPLDGALARAMDLGAATAGTEEGHDLAAVLGVTPPFGSFLLVRLDSGGETVGLLLVASQDPSFEFSEVEIILFHVVGGILGPRVGAARAAEQVEKERELYNTALSSLTEAVVLLDAVGRPLFANQAGEQVLAAMGFAPGAAGQAQSLATPELPAPIADDLARALFGRERRSGKRAAIRVEGVLRWFDYDFIPMEQHPSRLLAVVREVSHEVERESEVERHREDMARAARLSSLGALIGGVAHELNNPLGAILGFADIMATDPGPYAEELEIVRTEALRARDVVRDLLFIARPGPVEFVDVDLNDVARHVERLRRAPWRQIGLAANLNLEEPGPIVAGNAHHLTQVLLNLVTNAEHAVAGAARPRLDISIRAEGGDAIIDVIDNGTGMDEATSSRIFEPFFTTKAGSGTGLGLSLSHSMIASHQGTISVQSRPGAGSHFTIRLPLRVAAESPADPTDSPRAGMAPLRVLVIDDEPSLRAMCQRLFERLGHECVAAANVAETRSALGQGRFDLIVCDYRLGRETAADVLAVVRERSPEFVQRFVIATGATTDDGVSALVEDHGLRVMAKPYGLAELSELLRTAEAQRVAVGEPDPSAIR